MTKGQRSRRLSTKIKVSALEPREPRNSTMTGRLSHFHMSTTRLDLHGKYRVPNSIRRDHDGSVTCHLKVIYIVLNRA